MLKSYGTHKNVWIEITKSDHGHGGQGWEFGSCLWSPSRNRAGHDRYSLMRMPEKGDLVLHFYKDQWPDGLIETRFCAQSVIIEPCHTVDTEPPSPGDWAGMAPYYRIELDKFLMFSEPLPLHEFLNTYGEEIRRELKECQPKFYPFNTYGDSVRTVQGIYLAHCTTHLYLLMGNALGLQRGKVFSGVREVELHEEYAEGLRMSRERYFFSRNSRLVQNAKEYYGYKCQVCAFNFENTYGDIGRGYIECHHLNPFSERAESEWSEELVTSLDEVRVVCANCHRIIHRHRPALTIKAVQSAIRDRQDAS